MKLHITNNTGGRRWFRTGCGLWVIITAIKQKAENKVALKLRHRNQMDNADKENGWGS